MNEKKHKIVLDILGWILIVFGVLGLLSPFFLGVIFLLLGLYFISLNSPKMRGGLNEFLNKHPRFASVFEVVDNYLKNLLKKVGLHN